MPRIKQYSAGLIILCLTACQPAIAEEVLLDRGASSEELEDALIRTVVRSDFSDAERESLRKQAANNEDILRVEFAEREDDTIEIKIWSRPSEDRISPKQREEYTKQYSVSPPEGYIIQARYFNHDGWPSIIGEKMLGGSILRMIEQFRGPVGSAHIPEELKHLTGERKPAEDANGARGYGELSLYVSEGRPIDLHQFFRHIIREDCEVVRMDHGVVVRSLDKHSRYSVQWAETTIAWLTKDKIAIYVTGLDFVPEGLVAAYGERFPSALDADLSINKKSWGIREGDILASRLQTELDPEEQSQKRGEVLRLLLSMAKHIDYPHELRRDPHDDITTLRRKAQQVTLWWRNHRDKLVWNDDIQKLSAVKTKPPQE